MARGFYVSYRTEHWPSSLMVVFSLSAHCGHQHEVHIQARSPFPPIEPTVTSQSAVVFSVFYTIFYTKEELLPH